MLYNIAAVLAIGAIPSLAGAQGLYSKSSPVIQVTAKTYDSLIAQSNHTSIVEFYAPWCGHCKNLQPAYEKAAQSLAGLAKVAAINCDEEPNKPLCGRMGVQGFPTLKIVKPGSKPGRPVVEDYNGARSAKAIVDAVVDKIPNHVKRLDDSGLDAWIKDTKVAAKVLLFSDKGTIGPLIKSLAVDFLGSISFAQIRDMEKQAVEKYGVTKFPTVVLLSDAGKEPITYAGEMKRAALVGFLAQVAAPNPDPAPKKAKASSSKKAKSAKTEKSQSASTAAPYPFSKASEAHKSSDFQDQMQHSGTAILDDGVPTESPLPIVENAEKPVVVDDVIPGLPRLDTAADLSSACLGPKKGTSLLLLLPEGSESDTTLKAVANFADLVDKHKRRRAAIFPFYVIPSSNELATTIRETLNLKSNSELDVVAFNIKRKWWRPYQASSFETMDAENYVETIKLGEAGRSKLPDEFLSFVEQSQEKGTNAADTPEPVAVPEPANTETTQPSAAAPEPVAEPSVHDEL